jgi:hypothetical protein
LKKSKHIQLVLITALLASCNTKKEEDWSDGQKKVYLRSDSTARYSHMSSPLLWYFAFRSFGSMNGGQYRHSGYQSNAIQPMSNYGANDSKRAALRGGFGRSARASS